LIDALIRNAITRPMAVAAAVCLVVTFGLVAMRTIPIQLTPDVNRPLLQVRTTWPGAAPAEMEREITNVLEQELAGIEGVVESSSRTYEGLSIVAMEFNVGQNMDRAFLLISNRLANLSGLPDDANQPVIRTSSSDDVPIARMALTRLPGNTRPVEEYGDLTTDVVVDRLERVSGISQVDFAGGAERVLEVVVSPGALARYALTVPRIADALRAADVSLTAGAVDEGKRRYIVRTDTGARTLDDLRAVVVQTERGSGVRGTSTVTLGDVADVRFGFSEPRSRRRFNGEPMIRLNVIRETGANVMATMRGVKEAVKALNDGPLAREQLRLRVYYDETVYISSAIELVQQNIYVGGTLAALILLAFLRSGRATIVVGLAIPISVISTFVALSVVGRSINVISLAGIAFAVGMVVDAAIVVAENIYRLRAEGLSAVEAAHRGARQVFSAVAASAVTTVVVFVPLLALELTAGQLFRDIAVAISVSVLLSLIVAITVIPALTSRLFDRPGFGAGERLRLSWLDRPAELFTNAILAMTRAVTRHRLIGLVMVLCVFGSTVSFTVLMLPKLDYLPDGNRNFVIGRIQPPPGYNLDETFRVADGIERKLAPLWSSEPRPDDLVDAPGIDSFFFIAWRNFTLIGASATEAERAHELVSVLKDAASGEPDSRVFVSQSSIFGRQVGGSRIINLNVAGPDLNVLSATAREANSRLRKIMPRTSGTQIRVRPGLDLGAPEVRITPDLQRLARAGLSATEFARTIDVLNDGAKIKEISIGSRRIDLMLRGPDRAVTETQGVAHLPIVTPGGVVPAGTLADISISSGPTEIRHIERQRAITLQIRPGSAMTLEDAITAVRDEVMLPLAEEHQGHDVSLSLSGAAGDLRETWEALQFNLIVALIVVYLVMAVLFESLLLPLVIMLSVPLATAGGVAGLAVLNIHGEQPLDMLTMLGFVILIGIVVNNAILLVDRTLQLHRDEGHSIEDAIVQATRNRLRPIFMSTLTSVFGLLPLVLFPGPGSELYRGLGSVVVGGLSLSALLTLAIIPPLLALLLRRDQIRQEAPA
jgi:HAE1 family hydrophobic/amphiphilic exporter-1